MMIFKLSSAISEHTDKSKSKYELLGFMFIRKEYPEGQWLDGKPYCWVQTQNDPTVELNTLEELLAFSKRVGEDIVVSVDSDEGLPKLTIYDDYLE